MNTGSQNSEVLKHLKSGRSITSIEALREYGCFRLGARIYDLKQAGHAIHRQLINVETSDGETARVAEYWMDGARP